MSTKKNALFSMTLFALIFSLCLGMMIVSFADDSILTVSDRDRLALYDDSLLISVYDCQSLTVEEVKSKVKNENVKIIYSDGSELGADTLVGTGDAVQILDNDRNVLSEYTVVVIGDVNGDGKIGANDARIALRISARIEIANSQYIKNAADVSGDGKITAADARTILLISARLQTPPALPEIPITEEPTSEEPITEEPTTEEPTSEEPTTEEPTTEEPTTEEPTTEEPTTEEPISEEPITEEPVIDEPYDPLDGLPDSIRAFISGSYGFKMMTDDGPATMYFDSGNVSVATNTDLGNIRMVIKKDGNKQKIYMCNEDKKQYHELTDSDMETFGMSISDFDFDYISNVNINIYDLTITTAQVDIDGVEFTSYTLSSSNGSSIVFYMLGDELKRVDSTSDEGFGPETTVISFEEFYSEVPDNLFSFKGYSKKLSIWVFVAGLM